MSKYTCIMPKVVGTRGQELIVPCGSCSPCLRRKQRAIQGRIQAEVQRVGAASVSFLTLTYSEDDLPEDEDEAKVQFQKFMKRLRINLHRVYGFSAKLTYFACLERGGKTSRLHWHVLVFGVSPRIVRDLLSLSWQHGFVKIKLFSLAHSAYVSKYLAKDRFAKTLKSIGLGMSQVIALYIHEYSRKALGAFNSWYRISGYFYCLNSYYRRKIIELLASRGVGVAVPTLTTLYRRAADTLAIWRAQGTRRMQLFSFIADQDFRMRSAV